MTLGDRVAVMKDGVLQQVGAPMEIYESPVNRFVAGFLGTPPMNFIEGRLDSASGDGLEFCDGPLKLAMPQRFGSLRTGTANRPMVLGVRPDMISLSASEAASPAAIRMAVNLVEPLGDRTDVYMTSESGRSLVGRVDGRTSVREGESVTMFIDMNRVHVFEPGEAGASVAFAGARASVA